MPERSALHVPLVIVTYLREADTVLANEADDDSCSRVGVMDDLVCVSEYSLGHWYDGFCREK